MAFDPNQPSEEVKFDPTQPYEVSSNEDSPIPEDKSWVLRYMYSGGPENPKDKEDVKKWMAARTRINPQNYDTQENGSVIFNPKRAQKNMLDMAKRADMLKPDPKNKGKITLTESDYWDVGQLAAKSQLASEVDGTMEDYLRTNAKQAQAAGYFTPANYLVPNFTAIDDNANIFSKSMALLSDVNPLGRLATATGDLLSPGPVMNQYSPEATAEAIKKTEEAMKRTGDFSLNMATPDWAVSGPQQAAREMGAFIMPLTNGAWAGRAVFKMGAKAGGLFKMAADKSTTAAKVLPKNLVTGEELFLKAKNLLDNPTAMNPAQRHDMLVALEAAALRAKKELPTEQAEQVSKLVKLFDETIPQFSKQATKEAIEQAPQTIVQATKHMENEYDESAPYWDVGGLAVGSALGGLFRTWRTRPFKYERSIAAGRGVPESELGVNVAEGGKNLWQTINTTGELKNILTDLDKMHGGFRILKIGELRKQSENIVDTGPSVAQVEDLSTFLRDLKLELETKGLGNSAGGQISLKGDFDKQGQAINTAILAKIDQIDDGLASLKGKGPSVDQEADLAYADLSPEEALKWRQYKTVYRGVESPQVEAEQIARDLNKGQSQFAPNSMTADLAATDEADKQLAKAIREKLAKVNPEYAKLQIEHANVTKMQENLQLDAKGANNAEYLRNLERTLSSAAPELYKKATGTILSAQLKAFGDEFDKIKAFWRSPKGLETAVGHIEANIPTVYDMEGVMPPEAYQKLTAEFDSVYKGYRTHIQELRAIEKKTGALNPSVYEEMSKAGRELDKQEKLLQDTMRKAIIEAFTNYKSGKFGDFTSSLRATEAYTRLISHQYNENAAAYGAGLGLAKASTMFKEFLMSTGSEVMQKGAGQGATEWGQQNTQK